ncbi:MAG: hypothetical protein AAFX94_09205, partial [Myxococcota bacterium]
PVAENSKSDGLAARLEEKLSDPTVQEALELVPSLEELPLQGAAGALAAVAVGAFAIGVILTVKKRAPVLRFVAFALAALVGSSVYIGWVQTRAGLDAEVLSTPGALIDQAKDVADEINNRNRKVRQTLEDARRQ